MKYYKNRGTKIYLESNYYFNFYQSIGIINMRRARGNISEIWQ